MRGCCLTNLIVLGVTDDGGDPPLYLYHSGEVPISGNPTDGIDMGAYGSDFISTADYAALSAILSFYVTGDSGAFIAPGDTSYIFWIALPQPDAPTDWTWNGDPIVFTPGGAQVKKCYEATYTVPDETTWFLQLIGSGAGICNLTGQFLSYDQPGQTPWNAFLSNFGGVGSSGTYGAVGQNVTLTINDTYMEFNAVGSANINNDQQTDVFTEVAC